MAVFKENWKTFFCSSWLGTFCIISIKIKIKSVFVNLFGILPKLFVEVDDLPD